ncbi:A4 [Alcelaphine gammaherpesvirus 1]|uniref:Uncharacterized gene A4 protein n=1 Tax=Alcelaphine herpesvirus 1 (strain C500) TaxID=654901 RepID=VGA4_ALHV1|nr:A4 [Alcelaphine gammaherpesvirus 1]O36359.1 RecName: Full=Uncharacterized gene A4 protein [Alcelaphine herpesvirus 1 strain C500]AAC58055.1 A4 [Alcelaphine gammaherpesvirus 1]APB09432.1 protein A4 [Alcelaphine gammaherpesvirus 1]APB09504.1 protein A4 [Alcelaphine gammaherpesvirus 1]ATI21893.1 ORFA4 [Alcelaphine gammaherpesvirus 1]QDY92266.1 protein A4 [Alcelaphine gammaherpesvirus 1]
MVAQLYHHLTILIASIYIIFFVNAAPTLYEDDEEDFNSTEYDVFLDSDSFQFPRRNSSCNCTREEATRTLLEALKRALQIIAGYINETDTEELPTYPPTMTTPLETTPLDTSPPVLPSAIP